MGNIQGKFRHVRSENPEKSKKMRKKEREEMRNVGKEKRKNGETIRNEKN